MHTIPMRPFLPLTLHAPAPLQSKSHHTPFLHMPPSNSRGLSWSTTRETQVFGTITGGEISLIRVGKLVPINAVVLKLGLSLWGGQDTPLLPPLSLSVSIYLFIYLSIYLSLFTTTCPYLLSIFFSLLFLTPLSLPFPLFLSILSLVAVSLGLSFQFYLYLCIMFPSSHFKSNRPFLLLPSPSLSWFHFIFCRVIFIVASVISYFSIFVQNPLLTLPSY